MAVALLALAGCTTSSGGNPDDRLGRMLVAPGKYVLYSCPEIAMQATISATRMHELERLMAKASVDASGRFVNAVAYQPEYVEKRAEISEMRNAAASKNCKPIPALEAPAGRTSDGAVR